MQAQLSEALQHEAHEARSHAEAADRAAAQQSRAKAAIAESTAEGAALIEELAELMTQGKHDRRIRMLCETMQHTVTPQQQPQ